MQGKKSAKILDDYAKTLDKAYEEHTEDARKRAKMQEEAETETMTAWSVNKSFPLDSWT